MTLAIRWSPADGWYPEAIRSSPRALGNGSRVVTKGMSPGLWEATVEQPLESLVAMCAVLKLCVVSVDQVVVVAGVANMPPTGSTSMACGGDPLNGETLARRGLPTTLQDCGRFFGTCGLWLGCSAGGSMVGIDRLNVPAIDNSSH